MIKLKWHHTASGGFRKLKMGIKCLHVSVKINRELFAVGWVLIRRGLADIFGLSKYPEMKG